ncbi:MAG TPA: hypothetical protein VFH35_12805 [Ramlibacter sp.]|nr:hypothetical protein [Ramlibacter sp.]
MRFDQSITAFALESSGAAAGALGVCHTLTLPATALAAASETALLQAEAPPVNLAVSTASEQPASLTLTF